MPEQFWFTDPAVLFRHDTWTRFVPTQDMTTAQALNAVMRFTVYSSVLLLVSTGERSYLFAAPVVAIATVVLYQLFPNGKQLESFFNRGKALLREKFTMPTPNNPFMNVLLTDIQDNPNRPDAADIGDPAIRDQVANAFAHTSDLYMDSSDVFDQAQAMRTFHTMQSATVPNDQDAFLKWLAKGHDEPDTSSTFPSRGGKLLSEGYTNTRGAVRNLTSSTRKPSGTTPSSA
jgi:hypothetical protein